MRYSWSKPWDVGLAAVGTIALITEGLARAGGGLEPAHYVIAVLAALPLAWRRDAPLAALLGVETGAILCVVSFDASWSATAMVAVMLFTVALRGDRARSVVVGTLTAIAVVAVTVLVEGAVDVGGVFGRVPLIFLSLALGDTIRSRRALRAAMLERRRREEHEREQDGQRRVAAERLRIARELHDTLAHALVAINVRAGVSAHLGGGQESSAALRDIKIVSATALDDLRATLSLLREDGDVAPTGPALDLEALPELADHARAAGLRADVDVQVNGTQIPSAVGQAAFRIVQEALTNVLRHADASNAQVCVRATSDALDIEVIDDGHGDALSSDAGHGLHGMAERAGALGGQVQTGPRREGGWRVHAVLPLPGGTGR